MSALLIRAASNRRRPGTWLAMAVPLAVLVVAVLAPGLGLPRLTFNLATQICLLGIASTGINLLLGYGGMLSLGSGLFLGTAAYGEALPATLWHWPVVPSMVAAIVVTLAIATVLGAILVRLSSHYFAVANLGLATAFAGLVVAYPNTTGGTSGITTLRELKLGAATVDTNLSWYIVALVGVAIAVVVYRWAVAGRRGRILKLVREDELVASVLGVRTFRCRLSLYVISAFFPALAGVLLFPFSGLITPDSVGAIESVQLVALVIIGGVGYAAGGFLGAFIIVWIQALVDTSGNSSLLIYGIVFLGCAFYLRGGVSGVLSRRWEALVARLRGRAGASQPAAASPGGEPSSAGSGGAQPAAPLIPGAARGRALEVRGAQRSFGGVAAVRDVSLTLAPAAITALIGSNGAGKSTLVNLISGVESLDAGTITLGGEDISRLRAAERTRLGIARTFQVPRLVEELTVLENVMLGRETQEGSLWRRSAARERAHRDVARQWLSEAGLGHLADRRVQSLGTGERKFVELVRALDEEPAVCLLDEPAVGLSLEEIEHLLAWIDRLRTAGTAVLVIDHNLDFVQRLADSVYVMDLGQIVRTGAPSELLATEAARASLLGSMDGGR
jgi:branched-chain amino acid transport system permease protein